MHVYVKIMLCRKIVDVSIENTAFQCNIVSWSCLIDKKQKCRQTMKSCIILLHKSLYIQTLYIRTYKIIIIHDLNLLGSFLLV